MNQQAYLDAVNRLAKWRNVFAGRWLGTRPMNDPQAISVRDFAEKYLMLRVEVNAITAFLIRKGVFTEEEFRRQIIDECAHLERQLEKTFPGFRADDNGMRIDTAIAAETTKGWPA